MKKKKSLIERIEKNISKAHIPKKKLFEQKKDKSQSLRESFGVPRFLYGK